MKIRVDYVYYIRQLIVLLAVVTFLIVAICIIINWTKWINIKKNISNIINYLLIINILIN